MEKYFKFKEFGTDYKKETLAGVTTFLATCYIVVVNPQILSQTGMSYSGVVTATVLLSFFSTLLMGIFAHNPITVAPGMGLNAFFTFTLCLGMKVPWPTALGAIFWSGLLFLLISMFNLRTVLLNAIPLPLRYAISCGIGIFISLIGLTNAGFLASHEATIITQNALNPKLWTFIIGLFVTALLSVKRVKGAFLIGILFTTLLTYPLGRWWGDEIILTYKGLYSPPDFSLIGQLNLIDSLKFSFFPVVLTLLLTDMFDSLSTFIGISHAGNLLDEKGRPRNIKKSLIVDSLATLLAGLLGTSSGTSYIESAAGIKEGGKTGFVALVTAFLFLPLMFFSPLLVMIPTIATAPILVLVGVYMIGPIKKIDWNNLEEAIPCFLSLILIPLTYSITHGMVWGFLMYSFLKLFGGKREEVTFPLIVLNLLATISLFMK
ncbi:NCS2 family permease [Bacteriovoracales bacterium]|nr:NCS2 family permease [Bacteriovoracales bacterium]